MSNRAKASRVSSATGAGTGTGTGAGIGMESGNGAGAGFGIGISIGFVDWRLLLLPWACLDEEDPMLSITFVAGKYCGKC